MSLQDKARLDMQQITGNSNDFGEPITLTAPAPGNETATVNGFNTKHHMSFDVDGVQVNTKQASVAIAEQFLIDVGYPVRNGANEVDLNGHLCDVKDSTGVLKNYVIRQNFPDENLGLIVLILGDFE